MPIATGILAMLALQAPGADEGVLLFERHVLPTLRDACFECHGPAADPLEGGLRMLDRSALLAGGDQGPAIAPGDPNASLLVTAIRYGDPFLEMPPAGKLTADEIAAIERWVELGAPWPDAAALAAVERVPAEEGDPAADRDWWSFRPVARPAVPAIDPVRASTPIDAFLVARLDAAGIERNPPASRRELVRRAYHDLHGLPPTLAEVEAFLADDAPDAWERLVDRLLSSPRYAERWARHWLDLVRFAQTNGYERDHEKPYAWRYRDWVIDALDRDLPYDRFLTAQLAGDELPDAGVDGLIATGFYRIGAWDNEPDEKETAVYDELDDVVRTISEGMLGVTLACARCHDHKFDPIPQEDYYSMVAYLRGMRPYEEPDFSESSPTLVPLDGSGDAEDIEAARERIAGAIEDELQMILREGRKGLIAERGPETDLSKVTVMRSLDRDTQLHVKKLRADLRDVQGPGFRGDSEWVLCVREAGPEPPPTHVLARGKALAQGARVEPHPPRALLPPEMGGDGPELAPPVPTETSSGRRLALARWIASPENPLTARVVVNRVWQFHFGRAIAATPNDLGRAGVPPTHPELLDWLAATFVEEDGWSLKALHRRILLSDAYRASSRATNADALAADEANDLLWRQRPRRLTAEELRDTALQVTGELALDLRGGRGFFPRLSREALAGASRPGWGWDLSSDVERARRAVYAFVKRGQPVPLFEAFDAPSRSLPVGTRSATTTPTQALSTLNGSFFNERAAALAARVAAEAGDDDSARARRAYELVLARAPTANELALARDYLAAEADAFAASDGAPLVVRLDVPPRVDAGYLGLLDGEDALLGPRDGWIALLGRWGSPYNGTRGVDDVRAPALLHATLRPLDLEARATVTLPAESAAGFLLRAAELGDEAGGLEVRLDLDAGDAVVLVHRAEDTIELARFPVVLAPGEPADVVVRLEGSELTVAVGGEALGSVEPVAVDEGAFGLRGLGEGAWFEGLTVTDLATGVTTALGPDDPGPPRMRALEALCLALLNLNELIYVD